VAKWGARAINNMAKSRTLKYQLLQNGIVDVLNNLLDNKYHAASPRRSAENLQGLAMMNSTKEQSVSQWLASALDTLQAQTSLNVTSKELDRESRTPTPGAGGGDRGTINISSITGSSSNLWNGLESSAGATAKAVFGVAPSIRRKSSDIISTNTN
jgi:hypothetical protein